MGRCCCLFQIGKNSRNPKVDRCDGAAEKSKKSQGPKAPAANNSDRKSYQGAEQDDSFEDDASQIHGHLKSNEVESPRNAAFLNLNLEGILLLTLDVDGVEGVGYDYEDVLVAS